MTYGTLARVPLAGGAPRELQENVKYADWPPDGEIWRSCAASAIATCSSSRPARCSPSRKRRAVASALRASRPRRRRRGFELDLPTCGRTWSCFDRIRRRQWRPRPRLLQRIRARVARRRSLVHRRRRAAAVPEYALRHERGPATVRTVARVPGNVTLHDVAPDGRVLLARTDDRGGITVRAPGETAERTSRGSTRLISPTSRATAATSCSRKPASAVARVRLPARHGRCAGGASRRRRRPLAVTGRPMGAHPHQWRATPRPAARGPRLCTSGIGVPGVNLQSARFLPDGRRIVARVQEGRGPARLCVLDIDGTSLAPITPEGT